MEYDTIQKAIFESRLNRFIAVCRLSGRDVTAHVPNTGRCRELLVPARKTRFTLVCVEKAGRLINIDSLAPNRAFHEALAAGRILLPELGGVPTLIRPETSFGASRFDFYMEK